MSGRWLRVGGDSDHDSLALAILNWRSHIRAVRNQLPDRQTDRQTRQTDRKPSSQTVKTQQKKRTYINSSLEKTLLFFFFHHHLLLLILILLVLFSTRYSSSPTYHITRSYRKNKKCLAQALARLSTQTPPLQQQSSTTSLRAPTLRSPLPP